LALCERTPEVPTSLKESLRLLQYGASVRVAAGDEKGRFRIVAESAIGEVAAADEKFPTPRRVVKEVYLRVESSVRLLDEANRSVGPKRFDEVGMRLEEVNAHDEVVSR